MRAIGGGPTRRTVRPSALQATNAPVEGMSDEAFSPFSFCPAVNGSSPPFLPIHSRLSFLSRCLSLSLLLSSSFCFPFLFSLSLSCTRSLTSTLSCNLYLFLFRDSNTLFLHVVRPPGRITAKTARSVSLGRLVTLQVYMNAPNASLVRSSRFQASWPVKPAPWATSSQRRAWPPAASVQRVRSECTQSHDSPSRHAVRAFPLLVLQWFHASWFVFCVFLLSVAQHYGSILDVDRAWRTFHIILFFYEFYGTIGYYCPNATTQLACPKHMACPQGSVKPQSCNAMYEATSSVSHSSAVEPAA